MLKWGLMLHQNQLRTASLSQLLRNDIQLEDSSFESLFPLQSSTTLSSNNDIQQPKTTQWDSAPEAKKIVNPLPKEYRNLRKHRKILMRLNSKGLSQSIQANRDICVRIQKYTKEILDILSIKRLSKYIHEKSLPALVHSKFNEPV
jgi:hypothetical protein